jgi:hypothetical protein
LQELISEQSTSQQHSLGEIGTTSKLSQGDYVILYSLFFGKCFEIVNVKNFTFDEI